MKRRYQSWLWWVLGLVGVVIAFRTFFRFPWKATVVALEDANPWLLLAAIGINFLSPLCKGFGWHALIRRRAASRWWVAQEANLIGTAVNSVSIGPTGEAARIAVLVERDRVPTRVALFSVAASRVTEGLALACFVVLAPLLLDLPSQMRAIQLGGCVALAMLAVLSGTRVWRRIPDRLFAPGRQIFGELVAIGGGPRLLIPVAFDFGSWVAEWVVYHLVLRATLGSISWSASFTALIAANLGGLVRLTPGNTGLLQAAVVAGLLPFGVPVGQAVASGLVLQGVQTLPILVLCLPLVLRRSSDSYRLAEATIADPAP